MKSSEKNQFLTLCKNNNIPYLEKEIDLKIHDLPHEKSDLEWWYFNTHFHKKINGEKYSLFFCLFKGKADKDLDFRNIIIYSLTDHQKKTYKSWSLWDTELGKQIYEKYKNSDTKDNPFLFYITKILSENGVVPPDETCDIHSDQASFNTQFGQSRLTKQGDHYFVEINRDGIRLNLQFTPTIKPVLHGSDGLTLKYHPGEQMFYYFIPNCQVTGDFNKDEIEGQGWYDHEFSVSINSANRRGWLWFAIQLENNTQLSIYHIYDEKTDSILEKIAKFINEKGECQTFSDFEVKELDFWQSTRFLNRYPIQWEVEIKPLNYRLIIEAAVTDQEVVTTLTRFAFYEGAVNVQCQANGTTIHGEGFIEIRHAHGGEIDAEQIMHNAANLTWGEIDHHLPEKIAAFGQHMVKDPVLAQCLNGIPAYKYYKGCIIPFRDMMSRKGKAWRSFICLVAINAVGGNSELFRQWTAFIEFSQSASLILDDIQDGAETRRGKASIHKTYGIPKAMNAGIFAFFIFNPLMDTTHISNEQLLEMYDLYFDTSIATVLGQSVDIEGLNDLFEQAIQTGENAQLIEALNSMYALKTGAAGRSFARLGGILGKGSREQIEKLSNYGFHIGLGYQYVDDVIAYMGDARAFEDDLMAGKITRPIALAIPLLSQKQRLWLKEVLTTKDRQGMQELVSLLNELGVIESCINDAKAMIAQAWEELESALPNSIYKAMLYHVGIFTLDMHLKRKSAGLKRT